MENKTIEIRKGERKKKREMRGKKTRNKSWEVGKNRYMEWRNDFEGL